MSNRKMWGMYRKYIVCMLLILLGACASLPTPPANPSPDFEKGWFKRSPSDTDIFSKGMSYLGNRDEAADYVEAREAFDELLKKYPRSKWRGLSEILIRLIDGMEKYSADMQLIEKAKEENAKLLEENEKIEKDSEQIKKDNKQLLEETAKLVQENEQLKKDIQLLKSLEVELEKREKMLR
jgi:cell division protein FtsB